MDNDSEDLEPEDLEEPIEELAEDLSDDLAEDADDIEFPDLDDDADLEGDLDDEDLVEDDLDDDSLTDEDDVAGIELEVPLDPVDEEPAKVGEEEEDDDDEQDPDDVEASLDDILKDRLVIEEVEVDDEDGPPDTDDRGEGGSAVLPKRPDEFVCQSCFLVKHPSQLADANGQLCRDCV